jgi:hypothetical protein
MLRPLRRKQAAVLPVLHRDIFLGFCRIAINSSTNTAAPCATARTAAMNS